jgi:Fur family ferric uptake transcriptional regulator
MGGRPSRRGDVRQTEQRQALARILEEAGRPLGVQELHDKARLEVPGLSVATVYRNLRLWLDEGWLVAVPVPGEADRYEVAGKVRHHHFRCEQCDRVFEVFGSPAGIESLTPEGFVLHDLQVYLYGECADCRTRAGADEARRSRG